MNQSISRALAAVIATGGIAACSAPEAPPEIEPVAEVTTASANSGDLAITFTGFGTVEFAPAGQRTLTAEIEARVLTLEAPAGAAVNKGDLVLRLEPSAASAVSLAQAQRDAVAAKATAERTQRLRADGLASDADVETTATASQDLAELADSLRQRATAAAQLRAPIDGVIEAVLVASGDLVAPGAQLARLASPDIVQARIGIEIEDIAALEAGDEVTLQALDKTETTVRTRVSQIDTRIDPATRMASILIPIPTGAGLFSGEAVRAEVTADVKSNVILVPRPAVFSDNAGSFVFVAADGKAMLRRVDAGQTTGNQTEIVAGLAAGEKVIVEGAAVLSDGMLIRPVSPQPSQQP